MAPDRRIRFGGVAQAYSESVPILVLPMGYARRLAYVDPNFNSVASMRSVTKSAEPIVAAAEIPNIFRRAFLAPAQWARRPGAGRDAQSIFLPRRYRSLGRTSL